MKASVGFVCVGGRGDALLGNKAKLMLIVPSDDFRNIINALLHIMNLKIFQGKIIFGVSGGWLYQFLRAVFKMGRSLKRRGFEIEK